MKIWVSEAGRVQIRRKGLSARLLIQNKAQSPRNLAQVAQFISHWKTVSDGSALDRSVKPLQHCINTFADLKDLTFEDWKIILKAYFLVLLLMILLLSSSVIKLGAYLDCCFPRCRMVSSLRSAMAKSTTKEKIGHLNYLLWVLWPPTTN